MERQIPMDEGQIKQKQEEENLIMARCRMGKFSYEDLMNKKSQATVEFLEGILSDYLWQFEKFKESDDDWASGFMNSVLYELGRCVFCFDEVFGTNDTTKGTTEFLITKPEQNRTRTVKIFSVCGQCEESGLSRTEDFKELIRLSENKPRVLDVKMETRRALFR